MAEPENLVLSILREFRADMTAFRAEMGKFREDVYQRFDVVDGRLDSLETKTDGLAILLASTFGHLSHEMATLTARVDALDLNKA